MDVVRESTPVAEPAPLRFKTGVIVAGLLAALLGLLAFALANIAAEVSAGFKAAITLHKGIGPYSGKQAILLGSWLVSWVVFHFALRSRDMDLRRWFAVFLVGLLVAVLLVWPPVFEGIGHAIKG